MAHAYTRTCRNLLSCRCSGCSLSMMTIPVNEPVITPASKRYVQEALESGWISSAGPFIERFEHAFADFVGARHAITTTSGTTALHLALAALDIGPGDEVILPDFTMVACADAVLYTGATPVLVDVDPVTFTIDPERVAAAVSPRTRAIMPVHIYGHPADMDAVQAIASRGEMAIIEDAAEAHGARYRGHCCGSLGTVGAFSFYANKILTTGEGGMVVTDDDVLAERLRLLKDLAHSPERRFWHEEMGFNYRMTNLQAAVGLGQLESVATFLERKRSMAERYASGLRGIPGLRLPATQPDCESVFWMYAVVVEDGFPLDRDGLRLALRHRGIDTRDFFFPLHSMPLLHGKARVVGGCPVTEDIARRGLYLPSGLAITDEQIDTVIRAVRDIAGTPSGTLGAGESP